MTLAVSTCHLEGWKKYGQRMADTWTLNWPVPLAFFGEGFYPSDDAFVQHDLDLFRHRIQGAVANLFGSLR